MNYNSWSDWDKSVNQWKFWYSSYQPSISARMKQIKLHMEEIQKQPPKTKPSHDATL